jgi:Methylamine utilisation protein MauE
MERLFELVLRCGLAAVLAIAVLSKLSRPREAAGSLASFGLTSAAAQWTVFASSVVAELALAAGVAAGWAVAAYAASGLLLAFAAALVAAIRAGHRGRRCPCFGARGRIGPGGVVRNLVLAAAFAALPWSAVELSAEAWLAIGLGVALIGVAALTVAVLALAREIGSLRLRLPPDGALELLSEGPELGRFAPIVDRFSITPETRMAIAVFFSPGCRLCRSLEPAVAAVARLQTVAVRVFDEEHDHDAWDELGVPGSPYAVAIDLDGTVRAKGTFNSLAQLESVLATGQLRAESAVRA